MSPSHPEIFAQGKEAWNRWRQENPGIRPVLTEIDSSEEDISGYNLCESDLSGADLYQVDLSGSNLKLADLRGADLSGSNFSGSDLYKADFRGTFLTEAKFDDAYAGAADFREADLRGASFTGANLTEADFRDANLLGARFAEADLTRGNLAGSDLRHANFNGARLVELDYGTTKTMRGKFFGIRGLDSTSGSALFVRDARDQDYLDTMEHQIRGMAPGFPKNLKSMLFKAWGLIDFGRSLVSPVLYASVLVLMFGVVFSCDQYLAWGLFDFTGTSGSWLTPFYFSVVTYTTLGFGDITPIHPVGEFLVIIEVIMGYTTLGLVLSILANRVARRS